MTFDDAASATPVVTIPALTAGTELTFTLTVTGRATTTSNGSAPDTDTATVTATDANAAPAFTSSATFDAAENQTAAGTVAASDSDVGDSVTGYAIQGGADQAAFSIGAASGVLTFRSAPNFEDATDADARNTYVVVVRATSGTGARAKTADQPITVTVTDVDGEAPGVPGAPTVSSASVSSLTAAWAAPANAGPPITDYDYRYQMKSAPGWTAVTNTTSTALSATITGLAEDTEYEVQVLATNAEGTSGWSDSGSDSTATTPGVTVSKTALTVTEQDTTGGSYTVVLDSEPTATVTVTVAGHAGTDVTRTPGTLTFTTSNWDTVQTVTVTAGDDADTTDDSVTLTHSAASTDTGYNGITIAGVVVTVRDNDTAQVTGVTVDAGDARLVMNWTAVDNATGYTVQWKSGNQGYNTGNRQATVTSGTTTSHTITGLTNGTEYSVQVSATRTDANDGPPSAEVQGTPAVPTAAGVTVSKTALTVTEQDTTGDGYTVVLDTEPTATVTVTVAGHAGTDVTPTPGTLTFTTSNWDTVQTVTVTAGNDTDTTDDSVTLTHSAASTDTAYSGITIADVVVTVRDNDTAPSTDATLSGLALADGEGTVITLSPAFDAAIGIYTASVANGIDTVVLMATQNDSNAMVAIANDDDTNKPGEAQLDLNVGSNTLTVTVTAEDDSTQTYTITVTRAGAAPPPGVTVSKTALTVTEEDTTGGSYTVVLDSEPTATVTVTVAGHAGTDVTPTRGTLTFTTSNWDTVQTVTVTAGNDTDTTDDSVTLTHSAASTDTAYSGITIAGVAVTVRDNDTAQVTGVSVDAGDVRLVVNWTAVGNATGYTVQWKSGSQNYNTNRQATVTSGATTSYTIRNLTNGTAYTVRVIATRTGANDGPPSAGVTKTPEANTSTNTDPLTLTVEAVQDTVTEGEPVRYRIVMSKPTGGVEVEAVYRYRGEFLRHDPSSTITGIRSRRGVLYWEVERQTLDDAVDEADGRFTVRLRPGDGYQLGTPSVARVTIRDNDPEAVSPPVVSVADATVEEGTGPLAFRVTLDRAPVETATVDWETLNGSGKAGAKAGQDYVAASGTLVFAPGETVKTVTVAVLDDVHDEGREVMLLYLPNAVGAIIADALAKGTISNSDPLPRALMARFGRTAAVHVVEHVEARMAAPRAVGVEAQVAGRQLRPGMEREMALDFLSQLGSSAGMHAPGAGSGGARSGSPMGAAAGSIGLAAGMGGPAGGGMGLAADPMNGMAGPDGGLFDRGLSSMGLGVENLLTSSSFALTRETRQGGILSFWSRGARSSFAGREEALSLGGDVRTTMFGADYAKGPLVTGLSLSNSRGLGEYAGVSDGQVASAVTGLYPWLGYKLSDRVSVWGVTGYGKGALTLTPGEGAALTSGLSMAMAAAGTRGALVAGGASGFALAFKADALWVGTSIDGVEGPGGNLAATVAAVTRFRTGLEGSRGYTLAGRLSLRPSVEVGLRHDGGDAENGAGMDVGGGLVVSDASTGLAIDVRVRMLVMHQAEEFRERGMAVSLSYNPRPSTPLGFVARVAPSWGGQATSGAEALWGQATMGGLAHGSLASGNRLDGEVGYGLPVGSRFVGTPTLGVGTSADGRDYRLGYRLGALGGAGTAFELGVDAQRRERPLQGDTDHAARARATLRW